MLVSSQYWREDAAHEDMTADGRDVANAGDFDNDLDRDNMM